jgi:ferredoxin
MQDGCLCALGKDAPNPVLSTLKYFRGEYLAHIRDKRCPAGQCEALIRYSINPEACTGCTACAKPCPTGAITGEARKTHVIDDDKCIRCGVCRDVCRFNAVEVK